jgi:hypothetical protein
VREVAVSAGGGYHGMATLIIVALRASARCVIMPSRLRRGLKGLSPHRLEFQQVLPMFPVAAWPAARPGRLRLVGTGREAAHRHVADHAGPELAHETPPSESWDGGDFRRADVTTTVSENLLRPEAVFSSIYRASGLVQLLVS